MAGDTAPRRVERRRVLANVGLFSHLDDAELDALLQVTSSRRLAEGEVLFRKGDPGRQLHGVVEGRLKISSSNPDGKEVVFGLSDPGDVTGEIALLDAGPRSATVVALAPTELLTLDRRDFLPFLESHPKVAIRLAEILAARLRRLSELAEDSVLLALSPRLAKKLVALARSYGRETPEGTRIELKLSQQTLGEMVGTSRESINKQLRAWASAGLVTVGPGRVTVCDLERLESLARFALD
ncbi:MAG: Crp/Fnr family transcriptional regulator [Myxococcota bacterium]